MAVRALIIAIEVYPEATDLPPNLPGTLQAGDDFRAWLVEQKKVDAANIRYCAVAGHPGRTGGTTHEEVLDEVSRLVQEGRDRTEELYFFFSGHGFAYDQGRGRRSVDVLVTSEFRSPAASGRACIQLRELQEALQIAMGPCTHYWFVDACRNIVGRDDIDIGPLGRKLGVSNLGIDSTYTLFSTAPGTLAGVFSPFARSLLAGLRGGGHAKGWDRDRMFVTFGLLSKHVQTNMPDQAAQVRIDGNSDGVILALPPPYLSPCTVRVDGARATDAFTLTVRDARGAARQRLPVTGPLQVVELPPGEYFAQLDDADDLRLRRLAPPESQALDLYSPCEVVFDAKSAGLEAIGAFPAAAPRMGTLRIRGTEIDAGRLRLRDLDARTAPVSAPLVPGGDAKLPPVRYALEILDGPHVVRTLDVAIHPGKVTELNLGDLPPSPIHDSILVALGQRPGAPVLRLGSGFPDSADRSLALWLSLLGASRIVLPESAMSPALRGFPLPAPAGVGESAVIVLAAFEDAVDEPVSIALGASPAWRALDAVPGLVGVRHAHIDAAPGPLLVSARAPDGTPLTFVSHALADRATLITLTRPRDGSDGVEVHQYLLPMADRVDALPSAMRERVRPPRALPFVAALCRAQDDFAGKRRFDLASEELSSLIRGEWVDPIMSLLVAYELLRRGERRDLLGVAISNLEEHFAALPDVAVLARVLDGPCDPSRPAPRSLPLVRDGLVLLGDDAPASPLPASRLSYEGIWTSWDLVGQGRSSATKASI